MTLTWLEVLLLLCVLAGIPYCFYPLISNMVDLWQHRRHVRKVLREAARSRKRGDAVSQSWLRTHGYSKEGDRVA